MTDQAITEPCPRPSGNGVCGRTWSTRPKWKKPEHWRVIEVAVELNRRFGWGYDLGTTDGLRNCRGKYTYLRTAGIIAPPTHKLGGFANYYTDQEVEEIIAAVRASIIRY